MDAPTLRLLLLKSFPYEPTPGQMELLGKLSHFLTVSWNNPHALFILKGYAGTGKTTVVRSLVQVLPKMNRRTVLLAPTGRAAKVLSGYTRMPAHTIHRKIYFAWTSREGRIELKLQENRHRNTLFIVDEASMIQSAVNEGLLFGSRDILEDLFRYVGQGDNCRLLFIGDSAQLPPVGSSYSPALDIPFLKASYHLHIETFELKEVVRQSLRSGVLYNATRIREQIARGELSFPVFDLKEYHDIRPLRGSDLEDALNAAFV